MRAAPVGLVTQQRVEVAGASDLPQGWPEKLSLPGESGVVEVQVDDVTGSGVLVDAVPCGQGDVSHERPSSLLAAHQPGRCELGVYPGGGYEGDSFPGGELPVRRQPGSRSQPARADVGGNRVDQCLIP